MPLDAVQEFISVHGHLPGLPSADAVSVDGIDLGEMQAKTLEKVEELTLYLLEMKQENALLKEEVNSLKQKLDKKAIIRIAQNTHINGDQDYVHFCPDCFLSCPMLWSRTCITTAEFSQD